MKMYCIFSKEAIAKMNGNRGKLAARVYNDKFKLIIHSYQTKAQHDMYTYTGRRYVTGVSHMTINDVEIDKEQATYIWQNWCKLFQVKLQAKRVATEALAKMQLNERKWNLDETVVGLKRNEFGALEPVIKVEHE